MILSGALAARRWQLGEQSPRKSQQAEALLAAALLALLALLAAELVARTFQNVPARILASWTVQTGKWQSEQHAEQASRSSTTPWWTTMPLKSCRLARIGASPGISSRMPSRRPKQIRRLSFAEGSEELLTRLCSSGRGLQARSLFLPQLGSDSKAQQCAGLQT